MPLLLLLLLFLLLQDEIIPVSHSRRLLSTAPNSAVLRVSHLPPHANHSVGLEPAGLLLLLLLVLLVLLLPVVVVLLLGLLLLLLFAAAPIGSALAATAAVGTVAAALRGSVLLLGNGSQRMQASVSCCS